MKNTGKKLTAWMLAAVMAFTMVSCGSSETENESKSGEAFTPQLDTEQAVELNIAGFMGNFEALDQVINNFNAIYPNVTVIYEQNNANQLADYLNNNNSVDIFMTTDASIRDPEPAANYVGDSCLDLLQEDLDLSAIQPEMLDACTVDGALLRIPLMQNPSGVVVNQTLLAAEGLEVPETYEEFLQALAVLKEKGYTPIQGSEIHVYGELMLNLFMNILAEDDTILPALRAGDETAKEKILPVFGRLETILQNGYTDYTLNSTLPGDNYDGSIMNFFEGDVPFWVCIAECYSGMKKRESKSETYSAEPFEYEFIYAPIGDDGVYAYTEPWYGFSVCRDSDDREYAIEFMRFLATEEQMNVMASVKGMPSAAVKADNERYPAITEIQNLKKSFVNNGSVSQDVKAAFTQVCNDFGAGVYTSAQQAADAFVEMIGQ